MEMKPVPIPKSLMLHGQLIEVVFDDNLCAREGNRGENHNGYNKIVLQSHVAGDPQPQSWIEQAFLHELVHDILYHMESEKNDDEKFVNLFASLLHQALTTMEYGGKRK